MDVYCFLVVIVFVFAWSVFVAWISKDLLEMWCYYSDLRLDLSGKV